MADWEFHPSNIGDREYQKFGLNEGSNVAVRIMSTASEIFKPPLGTDSFTMEYPNGVTEIVKYRTGGISGTVLKTITVIYTNASKNLISSAAVT